MEKISVTIRVRPLSKVEAAKGSSWKLGPNSIALCNERGALVSGQSFTFDRVFGSESTTLEIYEAHTKDIIASTVQGFNGTVFAYGQTSSGKTFTMRGSPEEPGIIPLAVQEVFRNIQEAENREFLLRVSYMEIYNEEINDLLAPENRKLQVHENSERGIFVAGLREEIVVTPDQVLDLMTSGETYRHTGETNMNVYSSRSHTIFRMVIESRDRSQDDPAGPTTVQACDAVRVSVLNLVDLAGSERVAKTGAEGARLKEGTHINKSLMTLGTVINKLCEGVEKQGGHVPYRDSKLTRILQPALGGNAKTAVICNITPALIHVDETKGTLFFASRANRVTNCAQVNEIMTDAALLKRQKSEIEELRSKLQENHSDHWEEKILQLRNALLKTELDKERMALELQEEKKAQVEKERRLKEQEQKIENLSSMVINSAVDDRDLDKRSKKNNRRETWCPRIPSAESDAEESKRPFPKESPRPPMGPSKLPTRRERLPPLPPPFESLMEEEDTVSPFMEADENARGAWQRSPFTEAKSDFSDTFLEAAQVNVGERKRRSAEMSLEIDLRQQLNDLQVQFDDLQFEHELKMQEKMFEMEELKKDLDCAQTAVSKARKLDGKQLQSPDMDRRGKSLDGWEKDSVDKQLRAQVQNLELEKHYMQRELDNLKEQAKSHAAPANDTLVKMQHELHEARKDSSDVKLELSSILQQVEQVQKEKQWEMDLQTQLVASFGDLKCEVEATMFSAQALQVAAFESTHALSADLKYLQASVGEAKSLKAALENQTFPNPQSELAPVMKEHNMLLMAIQTVQGERDTFCEISKEAEVNLKLFEEEIRCKIEEIEDAKKNLNFANSKLLNAGDKIAELQSLLLQREIEQQALEQKLKALEGEALASDAVDDREMFSEKIKKLMEALRETTEEKAVLVQKGEVMHTTIQVLEGERDALMETAKQAQADMDRLQGKRRQELKEAQDKLELALSDNHVAGEQLVAMRSLLSQSDDEHELTLKKSQILESESMSLKNTLEEMVQNLETERIMTKQARADQAAFETNVDELLARLEVLGNEKRELIDNSEQLQAEIGRLCREIDMQGNYVSGVERKLESAKSQSAADGEQLTGLQVLLEQRSNELEALKHKIVNLEAEKGAMETCLATHESPESISGALVEMSLRLSGVEYSLQVKAAELEEAKKDFVLLQEASCKLQTDLAEAKSYTAAVEETLAEAVTALEASTQEKQTLTADLVKAHEDVALKITLLTSLQQEHALLFESLKSAKAEMEEARARWRQHDQEYRTSYDVLIQEKEAVAEERNALKSALTSTEDERDALKEQNFQAQSELKEFDVEVQRQRQEIDAAERALEVGNNENFSARDAIVNLESLLSQKTEEILTIQKKMSNVERESSSMREALESKLRQLESTERDLGAVRSECSSAQEQLVDMEMLLSERKEKIKELTKDHANLEAELDGVREYTNNKVTEVERYALDAAEERGLLVEKQDAMLAALQKLEEERDGFFMGSEVLKEEVNRLKEFAGIQETQLADTKFEVERAERQVLELQLLVAEMTSEKEKVEKDKDILFETTILTEKALKEELETQNQAAVSNLEVANAEISRVQEKLLNVELLVSERTEEKERLEKEKDVLRDGIILLQDEIAGSRHDLKVQQLELKEVESKFATASSEIHDAGKQLQEVHALLYENHQERSMLQQKLEELEASKSASEKRLEEREAELSSLRKAASEITAKLESHYTESSQLRSDIMGLRKELKAAKAAPAALEKERDGLWKDIEKLKTKMCDVEAKLKSTLVEKSKIETEKVNMDREVKHLRQSTVLLNKRESLVDKRRESVACGLNKAKLQLSSTEHALQVKTNELEKTAFDLQLLQDNYAKLEIDMSETEKASATMKEKLSEVETVIVVLNEEKSSASHSTGKISQELEAALEQNRVISAQLKSLQAEYDSLLPKLHGYEIASKALMVDSENMARSIAVEKENFAQQLIDAHFQFEEEKAAWASQSDDHNAKCRELDQEIADLTKQRQQVEKAQAEGLVARDLLQGQVMSLEQLLHESAEECLHRQRQLNANVKEHQKLLEKVASDKEHHEALEADFRKLEELITVSETTIREEREIKKKLVEETKQVKETIELLREMCKSLEDQVVQSKETAEEANIARAKQYKELEALKVMAQVQGERCQMLEEKMLAMESSMKEEREAKQKLSQEVDQLQERLQRSMEELARPPSGEQMRLLETIDAERCQIKDRGLRLEAECNREREAATVARKQVEKLQTQLNGVIGTTESLQAELDLAGMKNKNLSLEVDDTQAHLDKVVSVKNALRQQIKECNARISSLYESTEQINKERKQEYFANLTLNTNLQMALDATRARQEILLHNLEEAKDAIRGLAGDQATVLPNFEKARLEVGDLQVELDNLRNKCRTYEEELKQARRQLTTLEKDGEGATHVAEGTLQLLLLQADERVQASQEEVRKMQEVVRAKEETMASLQVARERLHGPLAKPEQEVHTMGEPETAQKPEYSTMELKTPVASGKKRDDPEYAMQAHWSHSGDTESLYNSNWASKNKVEQLKLQSQSLLQKYKKPWRIQRPPGVGMDQFDGYNEPPPPSATLHSSQENLTAPIYPWKKAKIGGMSSDSDSPHSTPFSEVKPRALSLSTRSNQRAALVPLTQYKNSSGWENRLHAFGSQAKVPENAAVDLESRPSLNSLPTSREYRVTIEKENL